MRDGERHALLHCRVVQQDLVHFARRDLLATAVDDLLQPAGDGEVPFRVHHALIAGAEPAIG